MEVLKAKFVTFIAPALVLKKDRAAPFGNAQDILFGSSTVLFNLSEMLAICAQTAKDRKGAHVQFPVAHVGGNGGMAFNVLVKSPLYTAAFMDIVGVAFQDVSSVNPVSSE